MRINWLIWDANCDGNCGAASGIIEELMVYGEGFPREVDFGSGLIDLGTDKNITALRWGADVPTGTALEIRSRTGNELNLDITYHDKNDKVVTAARYEKLIPSFRGRIDTAFSAGGDWSPWSRIYSASGEAFLSPSPRRYLELDVRLTSDDPAVGAALDFVAIDFSPPLANGVFGEIFPSQVEPGIEREFSYYLRARSTPRGFERISLQAPSELRFIEAVVDGTALDVTTTDTISKMSAARSDRAATGLTIDFPRPIRSRELVELRFATAFFHQSTRFSAFLEDGATRQRVDPGDANAAIASNSDIVRLPVGRDLLANLQLDTHIITPNADTINDELLLSVDLVNVLEPRPLRLRVYDLSGRIAFERREPARAGRQAITWDGTDGAGSRLAPGAYVLELLIEGDALQQSIRRVVSVAY